MVDGLAHAGVPGFVLAEALKVKADFGVAVDCEDACRRYVDAAV